MEGGHSHSQPRAGAGVLCSRKDIGEVVALEHFSEIGELRAALVDFFFFIPMVSEGKGEGMSLGEERGLLVVLVASGTVLILDLSECIVSRKCVFQRRKVIFDQVCERFSGFTFQKEAGGMTTFFGRREAAFLRPVGELGDFSEWGSLVGGGRHAVVARGTICLLYTSPSPRDLSTSRMPSSA